VLEVTFECSALKLQCYYGCPAYASSLLSLAQKSWQFQEKKKEKNNAKIFSLSLKKKNKRTSVMPLFSKGQSVECKWSE